MQMRIWFAPYVDSNDDLHFPSKVYTEVQPRCWAFGEQEFAGEGSDRTDQATRRSACLTDPTQ
jgi:hypothetical protein